MGNEIIILGIVVVLIFGLVFSLAKPVNTNTTLTTIPQSNTGIASTTTTTIFPAASNSGTLTVGTVIQNPGTMTSTGTIQPSASVTYILSGYSLSDLGNPITQISFDFGDCQTSALGGQNFQPLQLLQGNSGLSISPVQGLSHTYQASTYGGIGNIGVSYNGWVATSCNSATVYGYVVHWAISYADGKVLLGNSRAFILPNFT